MPRLPNKGFTGRAPQTAGSVPELPDFNPQLAELPGATETNAAYQRWWDLVRQRIEFNSGDVNKRLFTLKAQFTDADSSLSAEIVEERIVRADADSALASSITTLTATVDGLSATVTTIQTALATAQGYLEARWTLNVTAGFITTGMTLFSASGPDTDISYVAFQADRFQINTASGGNKILFSATATEVKLGNVLTVDLANTKMFIGTGTYANANTYFYVDTSGGGRFSLGSKFVWDGANLVVDGSGTFTGTITATLGAIGGWTIGATTLTGGNATLSSTGVLILGTSNEVVYISAADLTYRLWIGNATAGSATFRVTKEGVLTATGAVISGAGTGGDYVLIDTSGLRVGSNPSTATVLISNNAGAPYINLRYNGAPYGTWAIQSTYSVMQLNDNVGGIITLDPRTSAPFSLNCTGGVFALGDIYGNVFNGSGSGLTALNASNISTGTLNNARLPSAISVTTVDASGDISANELNIVGTEVINNSLELVSVALVLNPASGVKCNLKFDNHVGADVAFAGYMKIFANGGTVYVPYTIVAP